MIDIYFLTEKNVLSFNKLLEFVILRANFFILEKFSLKKIDNEF